MNYLQKIQVLLKEKSYAPKFRQLEEMLKKDGVRLNVTEKEAFSLQKSEERILFVTDDAEIARKLAENNEFVLAFLHEGNKEKKFSMVKYAMEHPEELDAAYFERVYRRLKGLPCEVLETKRCLIRETTQEDVEAFYEIYKYPQITEFMEDLYPEVEQEKEYVREYIEKVYGFYDFGVWTIIEKASGEIIGRAGFSYRAGFDEPELGFVIGVPWQRKGFAFEVCSAVLEYGMEELGFESVNAMVRPQNEASLHLCERLGFAARGIVHIQSEREGAALHLRLVKTLGGKNDASYERK